jgi:signal transduction histidine kinase/CheY-like chemotaxis protein
MYKNYEKKVFYRFAILVTMVIILVSLFMISFLRKKNTQQLSTVVRDLIDTKVDISHIDEAIQSLYDADNNFRFYTLTYDNSYFHKYTKALQYVARNLEAIENDDSTENHLQGLLVEKEAKATLFIHSKLFIDSLLNLSQEWDTTAQKAPVKMLPVLPIAQEDKVDTIVQESAEVVKGKKKLLGRLRDAIANKVEVQQKKQAITTVKRSVNNDPAAKAANEAQLRKIQEYYNNFIKTTQANHRNLNRKEYELIVANERLFNELRNLLMDLKLTALAATDKRRLLLSKDIDQTLYKIDKGAIWEISFIFLLSVIIIYNIWRLYKSDLEMLKAKKSAERFALLKTEFVATMSHEIRTPLNSLLGYTDQLGRSKLNENQQESVEAIQLSADMLLSVINNILDLTKMETDKTILNLSEFAPKQTIEEVAKSLQVLASNKGLKLNTNIYFPANTRVLGDEFRLKQILTNLISNAIKFTASGSVTVNASFYPDKEDQSLLKIAVMDTGIGISQEDLPKIFEAFTQGENANPGKHTGSGLGLHITKKIVDLHKGKIQATSIMGKGTVFNFEIPYQTIATTPLSPTKKITSDPVRTAGKVPNGLKLLVVDDSVLNRKLLALLLDRINADYIIVAGGEEAFELYSQHHYDMVLTDIDMPGMDGIALTEKIRGMENKIKAAVTIIAITGNVLQEDLDFYLKAGLNDYILKPYREEDILEKINIYIQSSPAPAFK